VLKLRNAMREYENDRWRIISTKVGSGFSPAACKEKAAEFAAPAGDVSAADLSMASAVDLSGEVSRPPTAEDDDGGSNDAYDKGQPESAGSDIPPLSYA
jgi:hypothetical protein